ncbi:MAG: transposase [Balneolaceae bacterium]|nr:transposase [Balneolaceae bacterium]
MSKRRTYSKEFKLDVIQQSYQRDNIRELADELGINPGLIYAWRSEYKKKPQQSFPGKGIPSRTTRREAAGRIEERTG